MAAIVESSDEAIIGKDLDGKVVSWNAAAERMFGYTAEEMIGQPIARLQAPDRPGEEGHILEEAKLGRTRHYETVRRRKDNRSVAVSLVVSPIRSTAGEIVGVSSIAQDITRRSWRTSNCKRAGLGLPPLSVRRWMPSSAWTPSSASLFSTRRPKAAAHPTAPRPRPAEVRHGPGKGKVHADLGQIRKAIGHGLDSAAELNHSANRHQHSYVPQPADEQIRTSPPEYQCPNGDA